MMQAREQDIPDLAKIQEDYFDRMFQEVRGMKCLVVDEETMGIISLVCSQSQILKKYVYNTERIECQSKGKMMHMKAIYFVRPTEQNLNFIQQEIQNPRFSEYYLYFSNQVPNHEIEKLAEIDENDAIKQIQEIYADYYVINRDLFTLNISSSFGLTRHIQQWNDQDKMVLKRMKDGLLAQIFSLRKVPMIRYHSASSACSAIADELTTKINKEYEQNASQFIRDSKTLLLILDRREDPITPLLNQWTYQAMLHELVGISNNKVDLDLGLKALNGQTDPSHKPNEEKQFVLSYQNDAFFKENMFVNFGELAQNIKEFIEEVQKKRQQTLKLESIEDMAKAVENIPELKKISGNLSKHVTLSMEVSKLVEERMLMKVSQVEQDISCKDEKNVHQRDIWEILNDINVQNLEKLKLVILYAYRYENCDKIEKFKEKLRELGLNQKSLNLINYAIDYAGKKKRTGDLFQQKNWQDVVKRKYKQAFKNVHNVFTQHKPYIDNLLNQIKEGKLKEHEYPTTILNNFRGQPNQIIIFYVGGCTYEEAEKIGLYNKSSQTNTKIILGGSYIHNSKTFLAEISLMGYQNEEQNY